MIDTAALAERYRQALKGYVTTGEEDALHRAYELGREALEADLGPLILFSLHRDAVQQVPSHDLDPDEFIAHVTKVLIEALAPFQSLSTSFDEAQSAVAEVGSLLERQLQELQQLSGGLGEVGDPHVAEIASLLERHAADVDEVRHRLENVGGTGFTRREVIADIVQAQEEERRRLAGDIHDDAVQAMTVVLLRIGLLGAPREAGGDEADRRTGRKRPRHDRTTAAADRGAGPAGARPRRARVRDPLRPERDEGGVRDRLRARERDRDRAR